MTFTVTFKPEKGNWQAPPLSRFRALLKAALRGFGLRAIAIKEN